MQEDFYLPTLIALMEYENAENRLKRNRLREVMLEKESAEHAIRTVQSSRVDSDEIINIERKWNKMTNNSSVTQGFFLPPVLTFYSSVMEL
jgi:hypothetical protein